MQIAETPGATQRLRADLRRPRSHFQQTFKTPLTDLTSFTATVVGGRGPLASGIVSLETVVFDPKNLEALLIRYGLPYRYGRDWEITATGAEEVAALLEAAWGDWVDFFFTPTPQRFRIFADHDEYTTIIGATEADVMGVSDELTKAGFTRVDDYERDW